MRLVAFVLMGIGAAFAIGIPWFSSNFTGEKIAELVLYEKGEGWKASDIKLASSQSPLRVRIKVYRIPGALTGNGKLKLLVRSAPNASGSTNPQLVLDEEVTLSLDLGSANATDQTAPELISASTQTFQINSNGLFKFGAIPVSLEGKPISQNSNQFDSNIVRIYGVVQTNVEPVSSRNILIGAIFIILGIYLFFRLSRRPKSQPDQKKVDQEEEYYDEEIKEELPEPPAKQEPVIKKKPKPAPPPAKKSKKRKTDAGKSIKWGRNADKDQW